MLFLFSLEGYIIPFIPIYPPPSQPFVDLLIIAKKWITAAPPAAVQCANMLLCHAIKSLFISDGVFDIERLTTVRN